MDSIYEVIEKYFNNYSSLGLQERPTEILLNGTKSIDVIFTNEKRIQLEAAFKCQHKMIDTLQDFAIDRGVRLDPNQAANGGNFSTRLYPYESDQTLRWHALIPPISRDGAIFSIRHLCVETISSKDFAIPLDILEWIKKKLFHGTSIIFTGSTGSGKSSLLSCLLKESCLDERVVILETLAELPAASPSWIRICAKTESIDGTGSFSLEQALEESLRLRPDRIVLGEIRGREARAWYRALQVCSKGCSTSIHCPNPNQLIARLADISSLPSQLWQQLFEEIKPIIIELKRGQARFSSVYEFKNDRFVNPFAQK